MVINVSVSLSVEIVGFHSAVVTILAAERKTASHDIAATAKAFHFCLKNVMTKSLEFLY